MEDHAAEIVLIAIAAGIIGFLSGLAINTSLANSRGWSDGYMSGWNDAANGKCSTDAQCAVMYPEIKGYGN